MTSNLCTSCGVAWDHHGTDCRVGGVMANWSIRIGGEGNVITDNTIKMVGVPFCPDLLSIDDMGEADGWRGQVVRGFFIILSWIDR